MNDIVLDGASLTLSSLARAARFGASVSLSQESVARMEASRRMLDEWVAQGRVIYGITTGFGPFVSTLIPPKYQRELQENLIRSHSANVGPVFSKEETRAAMALRLNAFAKGYSAVRMETANLLREMLNRGVHPHVPEWGSVGASGDLTPSAHIALAMMGEGMAEFKGELLPSKVALSGAGLSPVAFMAKEGLALINGTTMMAGVGALQAHDAWNLVKTAEVISVLSLEALHASAEPLLAEAHAVKPHPGQMKTAENLRRLIEGTELMWDGLVLERIQKELAEKMKTHGDIVDSGVQMQNAYSLRAVPQILGAVRDALTYATARLETEMNSANDNPLFFSDLNVSNQGANFHGAPVALPLDALAIALTQIGVISERRLNRMLDTARSGGLSPFLARGNPGLRCGFEGAQYIPTALVAECRTFCNPASIQSIPSNAENQDVVSMGLIAARKARDIKTRIEYVLAVELLAACEALEERDKEKMGKVSAAVYACLRKDIPPYDADRVMSGDMERAAELIHGGVIVTIAEETIGGQL